MCGKIKVGNPVSLKVREREYWISKWAQCNHKDEKGRRVSLKGMKKLHQPLPALKMTMSQGIRAASRSYKRQKKKKPFLEPPERIDPADILVLVQRVLISRLLHNKFLGFVFKTFFFKRMILGGLVPSWET